jgi:hypothetical protein
MVGLPVLGLTAIIWFATSREALLFARSQLAHLA